VSAELAAALWAETLKVRRSRVLPVTIGAMTLAGSVAAFFEFVLLDPERARAMGLLGAKAQLTGSTADWAGYFSMTAQIVAVGGLIVFGIIAIWLFGREFSDRTAKDLLALPTSRTAIVLAKLALCLGWCVLLTAFLSVLTVSFGVLLDLPGWSAAVAREGVWTVLLAGLLTTGLVASYALAASLGRGYLPAVGAMFLTVLAAQVASAMGYGAWFPWAVPGLMAGAGGPDQVQPGWAGAGMVVLVAAASALANVLWWERADHSA
jgi:ABC-2 type transport system permease protein